jgi:hypothetical protein
VIEGYGTDDLPLEPIIHASDGRDAAIAQVEHAKLTGLAQILGQLQAPHSITNRDFQSNCWTSWRFLGQPCEFQVKERIGWMGELGIGCLCYNWMPSAGLDEGLLSFPLHILVCTDKITRYMEYRYQ